MGYRGENLFGLPSPPSGPPFLPGGKLGPRGSGAPTPTMLASLTGGGPAINRARNVGGVQRSRGGGTRKLSFCLHAIGNSEHQLLLPTNPNIASAHSPCGVFGVSLYWKRGQSSCENREVPKRTPFPAGPLVAPRPDCLRPKYHPFLGWGFPQKMRRRRKEDGDWEEGCWWSSHEEMQ